MADAPPELIAVLSNLGPLLDLPEPMRERLAAVTAVILTRWDEVVASLPAPPSEGA